MSSLTLVRHAQASFFSDDYDRLSPLGEQQARRLGELWVSRRWLPGEVYVGPRRRHERTAAVIADVYAAAGLPFPTPAVLADLDEYDLGGILQRLAPELAQQNQDFAGLFERQRQGTTAGEQARSFQRMFEPLLVHWQSEGVQLSGVESWLAFRVRVQRCLAELTERPGHGRRVVAFTSGGFIGTAVQLVLGAPDRAALEINWRIRNAALTEFVFTRGRIALDAFNHIAHADDPALVTYR